MGGQPKRSTLIGKPVLVQKERHWFWDDALALLSPTPKKERKVITALWAAGLSSVDPGGPLRTRSRPSVVEELFLYFMGRTIVFAFPITPECLANKAVDRLLQFGGHLFTFGSPFLCT